MEQVSIKNDYLSLKVLNYGARIQELLFRDKSGNWQNTVVGFEDPEEYLHDAISLGACVGRFAGRISSGGFTLDDVFYPLYNEKGVHLHGGKEGFARKFWEIREVHEGEDPFVKLAYTSPHLEEGYPGRLQVLVTYQLIKGNLRISHEAITDRNTVVNLTNHSYFKMDEEPNISHYLLQLGCRQYLETHSNLLPTEKLLDVYGTAFDFQQSRAIGETRFDTPLVLHTDFAGSVYSPVSGIRMRVTTNQPAVVVYTPPSFAGICFETQNYPDAPNISTFPSSLLKAGESYLNQSVFTFDLLP
ncbi:aldose epimerase family protein [Lentiprolixibacter aurantiacus]|uniref:Galactose mutarotase n=1 Tax=Lentiprolixibacter aurantiacus TaxID=2993939 RepID=A0AAE3SP43_9FLAO|nr:aldose epimerase family protein [Lentiprolixibacter aurantiacus]MCX2720447.1 galactose mutarotase [Lentiprolixibacter aurantiacus]